MRKYIPNLLTLLNALSGAMSIALVFEGKFYWSVCCIGLSLVADFFDGFTARKLKAYSPLGKDLDSLADAISFGVAPASMVYVPLSECIGSAALMAYIMVPASVYRLAKFNHDQRQTTSFVGLPTPANAIFWIGIAYTLLEQMERIHDAAPTVLYVCGGVTAVLFLLFSWLLVSEIPMFSLKGSSFKWSDEWPLYLTLTVAVAAIGTMGMTGLSLTIGMYIAINVLRTTISRG